MNIRENLVARKYRKKGWKVFHKGLPDFIMVRGNKILFVEVKAFNGELSRNQAKLRELIIKTGNKYRVVRITEDGQTRLSQKKLLQLMKKHRW